MRISASIILGLFLAIYSLLPDTSYAANYTVVQHAQSPKTTNPLFGPTSLYINDSRSVRTVSFIALPL